MLYKFSRPSLSSVIPVVYTRIKWCFNWFVAHSQKYFSAITGCHSEVELSLVDALKPETFNKSRAEALGSIHVIITQYGSTVYIGGPAL